MVAWGGLEGGATAALALAAIGDPVTDGLEVVQHRKLGWSDDGTRLALGLRPAEEAEEDEPTASDADNETEDEEAGDTSDEDPAEGDDEGEKKEEETELPAMQIWNTADVQLGRASWWE